MSDLPTSNSAAKTSNNDEAGSMLPRLQTMLPNMKTNSKPATSNNAVAGPMLPDLKQCWQKLQKKGKVANNRQKNLNWVVIVFTSWRPFRLCSSFISFPQLGEVYEITAIPTGFLPTGFLCLSLIPWIRHNSHPRRGISVSLYQVGCESGVEYVLTYNQWVLIEPKFLVSNSAFFVHVYKLNKSDISGSQARIHFDSTGHSAHFSFFQHPNSKTMPWWEQVQVHQKKSVKL